MLTLSIALGLCAGLAQSAWLPAPRSASGAAYFITNEPGGNNVIASTVSRNGMLSSAMAFSTGGTGIHGIDTPAGGPDPLSSQGAVQVVGNYLYTINSGSNTVVMFAIDPTNPTHLTMVGKPVSTGGEFPISVAASKYSGAVCVLNGGAVSNVNCFIAQPGTGLTEIPNTKRSLPLNQTTPPHGPPGTASQIIFNAAEDQLIASVKGVPPTPGYLAVWTISGDMLSSSYKKVTPAKGGALPFSMTLIPGHADALLNTDPAVGFTVFNLANLAHGGATSEVVAIPGQKAICWSTYSPFTRNFYLSDTAAGIIDEVAVTSSLGGTLVKQYFLGNGTAPLDSAIASFGGKDFLYILTAGTKRVTVMTLRGRGDATPLQTFNPVVNVRTTGTNIQGMAVWNA